LISATVTRSGPALTFDDFVAGADFAFLQDPEIEPGLPCETSSAAICGSFMRMPTR
jgi:hypothetical protein